MTHLTDEQISELLDGFRVLNQKQQEHLQSCPECMEKLKEWRSISQCVQNLPLPQVSDEFTSRINYKINSIREDTPKRVFPSIQWKYTFLISSIMAILLIVFGSLIINYNNYENTNILNHGNVQPASAVGPIASNNGTSTNNLAITEEIPGEENILNSISEQYINSEPFDEELHNITISELLLSLAEETEEYNISDVSL
ncbi:MAG: anti-sigma factor family protein [Candidatus Hydrogenedens sp.]